MHGLIYIICFLGLIQQYWGSTTVNNAVTSVSTGTSTGTDSGGLGLVYNVGKMYIKKSLVNSLIGILIPSTKDYSEYSSTMKGIRAELRKLETMDILKVDPYKTDCKPILTAITVDIDNIQKTIVDMGKFSDNSTPEPKNYNCLLQLNEITVRDLKDIQIKLENYVEAVKIDQTVAQVTSNPEHYKTLVDTLLLIEAYVANELTVYINRIDLMEGLTNGELSPRLPFLLENIDCLSPGDLQHMVVNYCDKTTNGLFCEISLNVHKIVSEYYRYLPISYNGVQFKAEHSDQILLKSMSGHWEILDCEEQTREMETYETDEEIEDLTGCKIFDYQNDCTNVIETKQFEKILKHCNFTMKGDTVHIRRTSTGVLLQGDELSVKELDKSDKLVRAVLPSKYPVHVITNNHLAVTLNDREIILQPYYNSSERKIEYTYLTNEFLVSMEKSAKQLDLLGDLEYGDLFDLIYALLFLALIPINLGLCCCAIKNSELFITWTDASQKKSKKNKKKQKHRTNQNFEENTSFFGTRV